MYLSTASVTRLSTGSSAFRASLISVAEISGISDVTGSIEKGKDADIQLYSSDPLDIMSDPELVMISGEIILKKG